MENKNMNIFIEAAEKYGSDLFPSPFLKRVISRGGIFRQPRLETYIVQLAFFRDDLTNLSTVSMGLIPIFLYP